MQAILLIGIPACGKSTFYQQHFYKTHLRISLDMLKTRRRESALMLTCFELKIPFVLDNTNVSRTDREPFIKLIKLANFAVHGYYFESVLADCLARNATRQGKERIPDVGVMAKHKALELPTYTEGFDKLFYVRLVEGNFKIEAWRDEI